MEGQKTTLNFEKSEMIHENAATLHRVTATRKIKFSPHYTVISKAETKGFPENDL